MRWISTDESIKNGEVSALAVFETLLAMSLSIWVAIRFSTGLHIVAGAMVAPFLLLRTERSVDRGLQYANFAVEKLEGFISRQKGLVSNVARALIAYALFPFVLLIVRATAIVVALAENPLDCLKAFPVNWQRLVFTIDFRRSPEIIPSPEISTPCTPDDFASAYDLIDTTVSDLADRERGEPLPLVIPLVALLSLLWVPAFAYRLSIKSTAIIWLPFLWASRIIRGQCESTTGRLGLLYEHDLFRLRVGTSLLLLVGFAAKLWYFNTGVGWSDWWNGNAFLQFWAITVQPLVIPKWQLAMLINAIIALSLWFYVRSCLLHIKHGVPKPEARVNKILDASLFVSRLLSAYTIPIVAYLYLQYFSTWKLPELGDHWIPPFWAD